MVDESWFINLLMFTVQYQHFDVCSDVRLLVFVFTYICCLSCSLLTECLNHESSNLIYRVLPIPFVHIFWRVFWKWLAIGWPHIIKLMIMAKIKRGKCRNKLSGKGKVKLLLLLRYEICHYNLQVKALI